MLVLPGFFGFRDPTLACARVRLHNQAVSVQSGVLEYGFDVVPLIQNAPWVGAGLFGGFVVCVVEGWRGICCDTLVVVFDSHTFVVEPIDRVAVIVIVAERRKPDASCVVWTWISVC